ncbi:hypothetical protein [Fluviicola sp.]|uniref:hypothetical protein n=1 Tax=Fluviicola sp. TaxID=1917219 RepID=UPI00263926A2|nr:hypothetical protein [Fluviicola sp.]
MKIATYILAALVLVSCSNSKKPPLEKKAVVIEKVTEKPIDKPVVEETTEEDSEPRFEILLPGTYRDWEGKNPANDITHDWADLYQKNGRYYLGKADFTIEDGYSECSGDSTKSIDSKNKTVLFIKHPDLKSGELTAVKLTKHKIWPGEKMTFKYNGVSYQLRAKGDVISSYKAHTDTGEELFREVKNYKLYISAENIPESLFLTEESFNDTFTELLFIGDIDRDGKPDIIVRSNRDYEEERAILFLSTEAGKGRAVGKAGEIAIQFDC